MAEKIEIKIARYKVKPVEPLERGIDVFQVEVSRGDGVWIEEFVSEDCLRAFLRGVQAGSSPEYVSLPEIPWAAEEIPNDSSEDDEDDKGEDIDIPF